MDDKELTLTIARDLLLGLVAHKQISFAMNRDIPAETAKAFDALVKAIASTVASFAPKD